MNRITLILIFFCAISFLSYGQNTNSFSLDYFLASYNQSNSYAQIESDSLVFVNNQRLFKIQTLPSLYMSATAPYLNNSISPVTQPDGSDSFINRFYANSNLSLTLSQLVPFTGGTVTVSSSMVRLDNFSPSRKASYNLNLFNVSYRQNFSGYNSYKWEKRQNTAEEQLRKYEFIRAKEKAFAEITSLFLNLYAAQEEYRILKESSFLAEYIYNKAKAFYDYGRLAEEELLDAEIDYRMSVLRMTMDDIDQARDRLIAFLNLQDDSTFFVEYDMEELVKMPFIIDESLLAERTALYSLELNRRVSSLSDEFALRRLKNADAPSVSIVIGSGLNSQSDQFEKLFGPYYSQMNVSLSLSVPILNWGKNKLQYKNKLESVKMADLKYNEKYNDIEKTCRYDMRYVHSVLKEYNEECNLIKLQERKIQTLKDKADFGKIDVSEISKVRTNLMRSELSNINRIKEIYSIIYKYREQALIDIRTGEIILFH